jgi:hypothetical protein
VGIKGFRTVRTRRVNPVGTGKAGAMSTSQRPPAVPPAKDVPAKEDEDAAQAAVAERHEAAADEREDGKG